MNARWPADLPLPPSTTDHQAKWHEARVLRLWHWTPQLLSFRLTRHAGFRFVPGHYARLGLAAPGGEVIWRPFSMVSAVHDDFLEFLVVLVDGEFSRQLADLKVGDRVLVDRASFGFLTLDQLAPGETLWMLASGSGLGPFLSMLRDPIVWDRYRHIVLVHSVRQIAELAYRDDILAMRDAHADSGVGADLRYVPVVTREVLAGALSARIPALIESGELQTAAELGLDVDTSRVMVCGNPELTQEMRGLLSTRGFATARRGVPGQMTFEKYW